MNFFDIFIKNGPICMGFEADWVEKVQKLAYTNKIFKKMSDSKVIEDLLVFLPIAHHKLFFQTFFRKSY